MDSNTVFDAEEMERLKNIPDEVLTEVKEDDFDRAINENNNPDTSGNNQPEEEPETIEAEAEDIISEDINVAELLDAETVVEVMDLVMSSGAGLAAAGLKLKSREGEYEATKKEKKTLTKVTERFLLSLKVTKISPFWLFLITIVFIYGSKVGKSYVDQKMLDDAEERGYNRGRNEVEVDFESEVEVRAAPKKKDGRGRPKGSKNKNNQ